MEVNPTPFTHHDNLHAQKPNWWVIYFGFMNSFLFFSKKDKYTNLSHSNKHVWYLKLCLWGTYYLYGNDPKLILLLLQLPTSSSMSVNEHLLEGFATILVKIINSNIHNIKKGDHSCMLKVQLTPQNSYTIFST